MRNLILKIFVIAFEAMIKGGNMPCILNAANEVAVDAFLNKQIGLIDIPDIIEGCMLNTSFIQKPEMDDYIETDKIVRIKAKEFISII